MSEKITLPQDFVNQMINILGKSDYDKYIESFNNKPQKAIRINLQKTTEQVFKTLYNDSLEQIEYFPNSFYVNQDKIGLLALHQIGAFYSQEPASMIPVSCLINEDLKGKRVLDLCASPGGKSLQIASLIGEEGLLVSNEIIPSRAKILFSNIERLGIKNCIVLNEKVENIALQCKGEFDVVIVDAPCSGEGMFRKDNLAINEWSLQSVLANSQRQKLILESAIKCLKSNGILLYSTCTYSICENEENVEFLEQKGFKLLDVPNAVKKVAKVGLLKEKTVRCFPYFTRGEGQFCAVLKNENTAYQNDEIKKIKSQNFSNKLVEDFIKQNTSLNIKDLTFEQVGNYINVLPYQQFNQGNLRTICKGVIVGEIVKNRFEPHHQFFSAYGNFFNIKLDLTGKEEELKKYLKGEQLFADISNGYGCIVYNSIAVGGFKSVNGQIKNHYPKGLRFVVK